jgi:precorrin-3B synthase
MRRGWCPTVFAPMASGDGLLVRVKPPGSRLAPAQARALAQAAARDGNGTIELTGRANLQVRGLSTNAVPRFAAAMVDAGIAAPDPAAERRRNVVVAPLAAAGVARVAAELEMLLAADGTLASLPGKFGFAVALPGVSADVRLCPAGGAWLVWPDGAARAVPSRRPAEDALRLARAFLAVAPGARRMRDAAAAAVCRAAGLRARVAVPEMAVPDVIGERPGGFGLGLPFGTMAAATLAALADFGALHLTPWRAIVIAPMRQRESCDLRDLRALGLIVDPADPRLAVAACPGRPACASAHADTRADAGWLARRFPGLALHVSGCAKGCAHPAAAAVTLVAGADGYALIRDGTAADPPHAAGLTREAAAAMIAS